MIYFVVWRSELRSNRKIPDSRPGPTWRIATLFRLSPKREVYLALSALMGNQGSGFFVRSPDPACELARCSEVSIRYFHT